MERHHLIRASAFAGVFFGLISVEDMPSIQVAGREVLVDACDEHLLIGAVWLLRGSKDACYVGRYVRDAAGKSKLEHLHRVITDCPDDKVVDHINGDGLDNRRANLRVCTQPENLRNRKKHSNNSSGFKGVFFDPAPRSKPWRSRITASGKRINLGRFDTPQEAHDAYCKAAFERHGEFARVA